MANKGRGPVLGVALAGVALVAGALGAYFFLLRGAGAPPSPSAQVAASPAADGKAVSPPPAEAATTPGGEASLRNDLTIGDLLHNAGAALSERRYIDPPGNNAIDYYLLVLGRDPNNAAAQEGLRELFPLAAGEIEQKINAGQLDEGKRAIELLGKFDSNNYTLTILRGKLELKKKQMDREQDKRDQEKALAAKNAATPPGTPPATTPGPAVPAAATPAAATEAKPAVAEAATKPAAPPAAAKPAAAPAGETRGAVAVSQPPPHYPADAFRTRQEGWVEVGFTVAADGSVKDGSVITANPARVFNAAALRGITDWKFQPRLENGQPVEQQMRTRIEFKLPNAK